MKRIIIPLTLNQKSKSTMNLVWLCARFSDENKKNKRFTKNPNECISNSHSARMSANANANTT